MADKATVRPVTGPARDGPTSRADGQYFEPRRRGRVAPPTVRLDLPDLSLELTTDRGVFSADGSTPAPSSCCSTAPPRADRAPAHCSTSGAATARSRSPSPVGRRRRTVWAVDVNERARDLCAHNAAAPASRNVRRRRARRGARRLCVRRHLVEPADPHRQGRAARPAPGRWLGGSRPTGTPWLVVQKHLGADSPGRVARRPGHGRPTRLASRQAYRILEVSPGRSGRHALSSARPSSSACTGSGGDAPTGRLALALDGVQGPFNVGAILRTAAAYRVEHLWLTGQPTGPGQPQGRQDRARHRALPRRCDRSRRRCGRHRRRRGRCGFRRRRRRARRRAHARSTRSTSRGDVCLVVGHEDRGLSAAALGACDAVGFLPQLGRIGSLNVATAASIAMYEWARQQWRPRSTPPRRTDASDAEWSGSRAVGPGRSGDRRRPRGSISTAAERVEQASRADPRSAEPPATRSSDHRTSTPSGRAETGDELGGRRSTRPRPSSTAGGNPSSLRRVALGSHHELRVCDPTAACSTSWSGLRVCTSNRPPPARPPTSRAGPGQQRQRLLGGAVAAGAAAPGRSRGTPRSRASAPGAAPPRCRRSTRVGRPRRCRRRGAGDLDHRLARAAPRAPRGHGPRRSAGLLSTVAPQLAQTTGRVGAAAGTDAARCRRAARPRPRSARTARPCRRSGRPAAGPDRCG